MADDLLLWQLADSAFPAGSFAHSGGLEAAWQQNRIADAESLASYIEMSLRQAAQASLPFVLAVHRDPSEFDRWNHLLHVQVTGHVSNRASRAQGATFLATADRIFGNQKLSEFRPVLRENRTPPHFATVFGFVSQMLGFSLVQTGRLYMFCTLRGLISSSVRLGIVGPIEAQSIQARLGPAVEQMLSDGMEVLPEDARQVAPILELIASTHDRLYSRLFQS